MFCPAKKFFFRFSRHIPFRAIFLSFSRRFLSFHAVFFSFRAIFLFAPYFFLFRTVFFSFSHRIRIWLRIDFCECLLPVFIIRRLRLDVMRNLCEDEPFSRRDAHPGRMVHSSRLILRQPPPPASLAAVWRPIFCNTFPVSRHQRLLFGKVVSRCRGVFVLCLFFSFLYVTLFLRRVSLSSLVYSRQRLELMRQMYSNDAEVSPSSPDITMESVAGNDPFYDRFPWFKLIGRYHYETPGLNHHETQSNLSVYDRHSTLTKLRCFLKTKNDFCPRTTKPNAVNIQKLTFLTGGLSSIAKSRIFCNLVAESALECREYRVSRYHLNDFGRRLWRRLMSSSLNWS